MEPNSRLPMPPAMERRSRPTVARPMASRAVRSRPMRRATMGVVTPNRANEAVGSMPSTPVMVVPKPKVWPSRSSSGVTEVTAVRRLSAASRMAAKASTRPRNKEEACGSVGVMDVDLVQVARSRWGAGCAETPPRAHGRGLRGVEEEWRAPCASRSGALYLRQMNGSCQPAGRKSMAGRVGPGSARLLVPPSFNSDGHTPALRDDAIQAGACLNQQTQKSPEDMCLPGFNVTIKWSGRQDSNLRPLRPERSALPD